MFEIVMGIDDFLIQLVKYWNKIEHRLFSHLTMNWRGKPLTSYEVIVNLIAATTVKRA